MPVPLRLLALPLLALALLAGCGGSDDSDDSASGTTTTTEQTDSTTVDETTASTTPTEPTEDLGEFFSRRIDYELKGQFGRSWDELHPGQQALVARTKYEECRDEVSDDLSGIELKSLKTVEIYDDPTDVIGVPEKTSKAVTVRVTVTDGEQDETFTDTYHAVPIDGRWVWMLARADVRAFRQGNCPT